MAGRSPLSLVAAILIAVASVLSAAAMTPERAPSDSLARYLAAAGTLDDLCGAPDDPHGGHCPFCRLLSDTPSCAPGDRLLDIRPEDRPRLLSDLRAPHQSGNPNIGARAPPPLSV